MPLPGTEMYTFDHLAGGTKGGNWRARRAGAPGLAANQYGYNQARAVRYRVKKGGGAVALFAARSLVFWRAHCEQMRR